MQSCGGGHRSGQSEGAGLAQVPQLLCPTWAGVRARLGLWEKAPWLWVPLQGPKLCLPSPPFSPSPALTTLPCPLPNSEKLAGIKLDLEEIALTAMSQRRKLEAVLKAANRHLQGDNKQPVKWSVEGTWAQRGGGQSGAGEPGSVLRSGDSFSCIHPAQAQPPQVTAQPGGLEGRAAGRCKVGTKSRSQLRSTQPLPEGITAATQQEGGTRSCP